MDTLKWLQKWYLSNCDGDWEHSYNSIMINTLDNPGWDLQFNVRETWYENATFDKIEIERTEDDWVYCWLKEGVFNAVGGPGNLEEILEIFKNWIETNKP